MIKYLFIIPLALLLFSKAKAETVINDFEAELRSLEKKEILQDEKADALVEKISAPNNSNIGETMILDTVNVQNAAPIKIPPDVPAPISQESSTPKKTRRIPSR